MNIGTFLNIRDDLRDLEEALSPVKKDPQKAAILNRRLVEALLKMAESQIVRADLELTELEVARLRKIGEMTASMRAKFRIYTDNFLRENIGI